ncbi:DUF885 domain-containing protein [Microbulbifer variabilis]|uniref:DUF885 domain-containing protein n=1 Tax=Microbulbifer variabilis TaxID=266805 RepID=UPI001CFD1ABE|nr:DUF885 domain-containing protein [Microbulbifer variabilis]
MSLLKKALIASIGMFASFSVTAMDQNDFKKAFRALPTKNVSERLTALQDLRYRWIMESFPSQATYEGYPGQNDRWVDNSSRAIQQRQEQTRQLLGATRNLNVDALPEQQRLDYQLLYQDLLGEVKGFHFPEHLQPITHMSGIQRDVPDVLNSMPRSKVADYEDILARLSKLPTLVTQTQALMQQGLSKGVTPPQITLRDLPRQIRALIPTTPEQSPLLSAFAEMPKTIPKAKQKSLRQRALAIYNSQLLPAWRDMAEFIERDYIPGAQKDIALSSRPDGLRWYAHKVHQNTTTDLSPEEIHRIGLAEVKRIRGEMDRIIQKAGFKGDFKAFTEFLRTDPRFYHTSREGLLRDYRDIAKRIDGELPALFGILPRLPYGVKPIPSYSEQSQTTAYYQPGSNEAGRAGIFYANTYNLPSRPKWEMEALTVHEAMPGHHLQIALAQEQTDIHPLRRMALYTAFVEGWGLYSESLGYDLGLYKDPYSEFGALTYDMWRAVRLVVDTGMHQLGWSREQAIDYFMENSAKPLHDVTVEIDRYLVWPGQALAYKLGQLKIKELRVKAEEELDNNFDIRSFHDALLGAGALPLNVLEERMQAWIEDQGSASAQAILPSGLQTSEG